MSKAKSMSTGMSHIGICVRDLDLSLGFYRDVLGMEVLRDEMIVADVVPEHLYADRYEGARRIVYLRYCEAAGAPTLVMSENPQTGVPRPLLLDQVGVHHIAFGVPDVESLMQELTARGAQVFGPAQSYRGADGRMRTVFFRDPDGLLVQFDEELF